MPPLDYQHLFEFAEALSAQNSFDEILSLIANESATLLVSDYAVIVLINPQTRETRKTVLFSGGTTGEQRLSQIRHSLIAGWIFQQRRPLLANNIHKDSRFKEIDFDDQRMSVLGAPLQIAGTLLGAILVVRNAERKGFDSAEMDYLKKIATISVPYFRNTELYAGMFLPPASTKTLIPKYRAVGLIGKSKPFLEMLQAIEAAARTDIRVLLQGESGTGKELVARALHKFGRRAEGPFVAVDCGAIPENLVEAELFGHEKGAFTGAVIARKGWFEKASGGTLFLDEIANLSLAIQAKLMRVLQEGEIMPLGGGQLRKVDVRVISASSAALQGMVQEGRFREDLFYRLHIYPIYIPSLNERRKDIGLLVRHFLEQSSRPEVMFPPHIIDWLKQKDWPGNIRELQNLVERLLALTPPEANSISLTMLPPDLKTALNDWRADDAATASFNEQLSTFSKQVILEALERCEWNQSRAARMLGMSEHNIRYHMRKLGIRRP